MKSKDPSSNSKHLDKGKTTRLNKFLSNAGLCSRREADEFIKMGLVHVNGKIVTEMGYQVKSNDEVKYDGSRVQKSPPMYILLNKPKGFVATSQGGKINKSVENMITKKKKKPKSIIKEFSDYTLSNEIENIRQLLDINGEFEIQDEKKDN